MTCGSCNRVAGHGSVYIEMTPGRYGDRKPWWLCHSCWSPGRAVALRDVKPPKPKRRPPERGGLM